MAGVETGDREAFLARLRTRSAVEVPPDVAHPLPGPLDAIPVAVSSLLDPDDLVGSFVRNARAVMAEVDVVEAATVPAELVESIVRARGVQRAVVGREPEAQAVGELLRGLGVAVEPVGAAAAAAADLGVTVAVAALATTGSVLQSSEASGGRTASLLPPVHLCLVPASRVVPGSADVLRPLGDGRSLPSNLAIVTGPSRSADIEQTIALGVHGPLVVHLVVLSQA